jgi:hypothetical protein
MGATERIKAKAAQICNELFLIPHLLLAGAPLREPGHGTFSDSMIET